MAHDSLGAIAILPESGGEAALFEVIDFTLVVGQIKARPDVIESLPKAVQG